MMLVFSSNNNNKLNVQASPAIDNSPLSLAPSPLVAHSIHRMALAT